MTFHHRLAAALLACTSLAHALPDTAFQPAFDQFTQAAQGRAAPESAVKAFAGLRAQEPGNPVLTVYQGAATAMQARDTWLPWQKMRHAEDGLALIDKALALLNATHNAPVQRGTPGVLEVKLTAANTFLAVPGFMNRRERGQKLLADVLASPLLATAPLPFQAAAWLLAAEQALKDEQPAEARRYLTQVAQSNAPQASQARARLAALPQ
ncbi:hypothetical protein [Ottowia testudinis]|uniref:Uncharacterized protein n=1 Tax=Ottowia testudinis TaxID=2816950 RepID=A0A975CDT6_9BURK|nr:hypothetical protein [Ottowia testudinis]QTD44022.1 hypothetical protein J1M35_12840 [Ottowia testudinis]